MDQLTLSEFADAQALPRDRRRQVYRLIANGAINQARRVMSNHIEEGDAKMTEQLTAQCAEAAAQAAHANNRRLKRAVSKLQTVAVLAITAAIGSLGLAGLSISNTIAVTKELRDAQRRLQLTASVAHSNTAFLRAAHPRIVRLEKWVLPDSLQITGDEQ